MSHRILEAMSQEILAAQGLFPIPEMAAACLEAASEEVGIDESSRYVLLSLANSFRGS